MLVDLLKVGEAARKRAVINYAVRSAAVSHIRIMIIAFKRPVCMQY